jgi:hypothetical protein
MNPKTRVHLVYVLIAVASVFLLRRRGDGMFPELVPLAYEAEPSSFLAGIPQAPRRLYSEEAPREIDLAILGLVEAALTDLGRPERTGCQRPLGRGSRFGERST